MGKTKKAKKSGEKTFVVIENVPVWAESYLYYGKDPNLGSYNIGLVEEWLRSPKMSDVQLVGPIEGTFNRFCRFPAFGDACDTEDWNAFRIEGPNRKFKVRVRKTMECVVEVKANSKTEAKSLARTVSIDKPFGWVRVKDSVIGCDEIRK